MSFGPMVKSLRIAQKKTLRQFCADNGHDPSNWSKIERGVNPPPSSEITLGMWAEELGLVRGTEAWQRFMDEAAVARGAIPESVLSNEQLAGKLPVFFRTIRDAELTEAQMDEFIERVRELHTPDAPEG